MKFSVLKIIIISLIFGLAAGIVGSLLVEAYLLPPQPSLVSFQKLAEKKKPAIPEETEANLAVERAFSTTVDIHLAKKENQKEILDQVYLPSEALGKGVILTSDGWILTTNEVINDLKNEYLIVTFDKKSYKVEELILDKFSGAIFLKVETENLPVAGIGDKEELKIGQDVVALEDGLSFSKIASINFEPAGEKIELIKSSEKISKFILINGKSYKPGTPLVNLKGEIIGLVLSKYLTKENFTAVLPVSDIKNAFVDILKYKKIKRPFLGVNYIDLASVSFLNEEINYGLIRGALLYENKNLNIKAVLDGSPGVGLLKPRDIIIKVDKEELSALKDLTNIIQEYKAGDSIDLLILRGEKELTIPVKLEELK